MTEEFNNLIALAKIAGVFVGFGALISITGRTEINRVQLGQIRAVVTIGLVVIVAALVPVGLGYYGITGHALWLMCSLIFLALIWAVTLFSLQHAENRALTVARARANPVMAVFFWFLLEIPMQVPLVLAITGFFPALEPAFYMTALILNLFQAAFVLAQFVYSQHLQPAS